MSHAHNLATGATGSASAQARGAPARVFAAFEICGDPQEASAAWDEIYADGLATAYQSRNFVELWLRTVGRAEGVEPMIVLVRDERGRASALLPLVVRARLGLRAAEFIGGKHANFHMGVFRAGLAAGRDEVLGLLRRIGESARLDAFFFVNQPERWQGSVNPLHALGGQKSPSFGHSTQLQNNFAQWLETHYSKAARRKLRKKTRRLAERGVVSSFVARDEPTAREALATFFAHKRARAKATGLINDFDDPAAARFLEIAACESIADREAVIELRAMRCGERIVAVFGGLAHAGRFYGVVTSHDPDAEIARSSPGELLILDIVRDLHERGFKTFDLGVGEARYKDAVCETSEALFDFALGLTLKGRIASPCFLLARRVKRWIKQRPWAWSLVAPIVGRTR
ncbi:MAG TPA: GNAT family N-acetyltransferase [Roseiarcus sp.]|nr:GNAT family N-acetyltransferase [Roseiarcus sp.]